MYTTKTNGTKLKGTSKDSPSRNLPDQTQSIEPFYPKSHLMIRHYPLELDVVAFVHKNQYEHARGRHNRS
jgi:hypothetical protein